VGLAMPGVNFTPPLEIGDRFSPKRRTVDVSSRIDRLLLAR
jgi:hypothetical protein